MIFELSSFLTLLLVGEPNYDSIIVLLTGRVMILDIVVVIYPHTDFYLSNLGIKNRFLCRWAFPLVELGKSV